MRDQLALADHLMSDWDSWRTVASTRPGLTPEMLALADATVSGEFKAPHVRTWWIPYSA
jgi:hypothetical protein